MELYSTLLHRIKEPPNSIIIKGCGLVMVPVDNQFVNGQLLLIESALHSLHFCRHAETNLKPIDSIELFYPTASYFLYTF